MNYTDDYDECDFVDQYGAGLVEKKLNGTGWVELERDGYGNIVGTHRVLVHDRDTIQRKLNRAMKVPGTTTSPISTPQGEHWKKEQKNLCLSLSTALSQTD